MSKQESSYTVSWLLLTVLPLSTVRKKISTARREKWADNRRMCEVTDATVLRQQVYLLKRSAPLKISLVYSSLGCRRPPEYKIPPIRLHMMNIGIDFQRELKL